jgi:nicotinate-nucleotide--dimethylbenzimidazole phosphoribosyltransferase
MLSARVRQTIENIRPLLDPKVVQEAARRWRRLPKPEDSLGRIEELVLHYALIRGSADAAIRRKALYVVCADHGAALEGITVETQDDTPRRIRQFLHGGMAANVLCRQYTIEQVVIDAGVRGPAILGVLPYRVVDGSGNFTKTPALTTGQANDALERGLDLAREAHGRFDAIGIAQIGVAAVGPASALLSVFSGRDAADTTPREPAANDAVYHRRLQAVRAAAARHQNETVAPFGALRCLGGADIALMAGLILGAAELRIPVVIDDFIACAAALVARAFCPDSLDAAIFSMHSGDPAHSLMLQTLNVAAQFDLGVREGAGFGAAFTLHLLETALRLFREISEPGEPQALQ